MASLNLTSFDPILKKLYTDRRIENMVYQNNPFLAMVAKNEGFFGKDLDIRIKHGNPQGRAGTFSNAQTNKSASVYKAFTLTRKSDYSIASIDGETIEASASDKGAFLRALVSEIDNAMDSLTRSMAISCYRSGSGSIGQVANSSFATTVLTLTNADDVVNFEVNQVCKFDSVDGGGTEHSGSLTVTSVDRDAGTVTFNSNLSTISGIATNDYIFTDGDYDKKMSGLIAWLPDSAPTSGDSFFGVDRSVDPVRLAGNRYDASGVPIEEALVTAANKIGRNGGRPSHVFLPYSYYADLINSLGSKAVYINEKVADVGFSGVQIQSPTGAIKVVPDINCIANRAFMLQLDTWTLNTLGKAPKFAGNDGMQVLREASADAVEARIVARGNLGCSAPGWNCNIKLA